MANPIRQKEIDERIGKFADKFWGAFQMTENGRVKSTILLYSFCLCWVLLACLIALIVMMGLESMGLVLQFFGMFVLAPLALGLSSSLLAYYLYWKKRPRAEDSARPWKRQ